MTADGLPVDLLQALLAEMRGLRSDFARHTATRPGLLSAIMDATGSTPFTAAEIIRKAGSQPGPLRDALAGELRTVTARALGKALGRAADAGAGGFRVERCGCESGGAIWRVSVVMGAPNP